MRSDDLFHLSLLSSGRTKMFLTFFNSTVKGGLRPDHTSKFRFLTGESRNRDTLSGVYVNAEGMVNRAKPCGPGRSRIVSVVICIALTVICIQLFESTTWRVKSYDT